MNYKQLSIIAILCAGVLFSCVPARKYEELKAKQTACLEENSALKAQNQSLEEQNQELTASVDKLKKEKAGLEHEISVLEKSLDQMTPEHFEWLSREIHYGRSIIRNYMKDKFKT